MPENFYHLFFVAAVIMIAFKVIQHFKGPKLVTSLQILKDANLVSRFGAITMSVPEYIEFQLRIYFVRTALEPYHELTSRQVQEYLDAYKAALMVYRCMEPNNAHYESLMLARKLDQIKSSISRTDSCIASIPAQI